jgi:glutamate-1-semialdehyde 2,1-aminomutase
MGSSGQQLYQRARKRIPGATQLLSKRAEMFLPNQWPSYYSRARGVELWDLDGEKYVDMAYSGIGACILGYADPDVDAAVHEAIRAGTMTTLNCPEELELADLLCELHPWAEMARFARTGGEAMAMAVRVARAKTGRDKLAFCGYHGWHDWYLAANLSEDDALVGHLLPGLAPAGVPQGLRGTAFPFHYNDVAELQEIASRNALAAIVMEPVRSQEPQANFLESVKWISRENGAVLIFDEISSGWRLNTGAAHLLYGVSPDMAVFAKAMSNGYAMAAIIGVADVMQAFQSTFVSSTYWTEKIGPVAALTTIRKHRRCDVAKHLVRVGNLVKAGWRTAAEQAGLRIELGGIPPMSTFAFDCDDPLAARTLFTQLMLERHFLATGAFYASYSHQPEHIENYLRAVEESFAIVARAIEADDVHRALRGPVAHAGFYRLT